MKTFHEQRKETVYMQNHLRNCCLFISVFIYLCASFWFVTREISPCQGTCSCPGFGRAAAREKAVFENLPGRSFAKGAKALIFFKFAIIKE